MWKKKKKSINRKIEKKTKIGWKRKRRKVEDEKERKKWEKKKEKER